MKGGDRTMDEINERIKAIVSESGLTKTAFSQKLNVTQQYVSNLCLGKKTPSDRTIRDICREFNVSERWLRTGVGEMFVERSREEELAAFMGDLLCGESDFRRQLICVLARMEPEEWKLLEKKVLELAEEIKKASPDRLADGSNSDGR